jgi:2-polyprenyl-3-methyl-5-hydroxy-6-metoxy-1,4-benzoquinol methylase
MNESMENALRYHIEVDLSQENTSHAQLIKLTGRNKRVLEVGPATGYVTKVLQQRGCRVWCIENDAEAAEVAAEFSERMVVANVETVDFNSTFPEERFDVVTFGDVLEHLVDPMGVLMRVKDVLKPGGCVVASVPNVAHASIRLSLLKGQFNYTEMGLLDRTHLRFFTRESLADLFFQAGYEVRDWRRILTDPFATEIALREEEFPSHLRDAARGDIEAMTYQFVVSAYPVKSGRNGRRRPSAASRPAERNLLDDVWRWQKEHHARETSLARSLAQRNATLSDREDLLARRERSLQEVSADLAAVEASLGYKMLQVGRRGIGRVFPSSSWWSGPYRLITSTATWAKKARPERQRASRKVPPAFVTEPAAVETAGPLTEAQYYRRQLAALCHGRGIELGALHAPTQGLPDDSAVLYVDKESTRSLKIRFAVDDGLRPESIVDVDVVSDAGCLAFDSGALDFLIANHVIEHLPNPLGALAEWHRCLKEGGRLFLTVPDKRFCFDAERSLTDWSHLLADMQRNDDGLTDASREHLREWIRNVEGTSEDGIEQRVEHHLSTALDYHCHTWTHESLLGTLDRCGSELGLRFEREAELNSYETWGETILVLKKNRDAPALLPARYRYPEWQFDRKGRILGEILPGILLEQSFTCAHDGLNAVHVRFGTYSRANSGPLVFQLFAEGPQDPLARVEVDMSELRDNFFHAFRFPPIKKSAGNRFRFTLEAPQASLDNAVTVWAADANELDVQLKANGSPVEGTTLNFKAFSIARLDKSHAWAGERVPPPPVIATTNGLRGVPAALRSLIGKGGPKD